MRRADKETQAAKQKRSTQAAGFTLPELVTVVVIVAVLAFVALPRLTALDSYCAAQFHDTVLAALRYARSGAIAHGRPVCVTVANNRLAVWMAHTRSSDGCSGTARTPFYPPDFAAGEVARVGDEVVAPERCRSQVMLSASDTPFTFCPRGDIRVGAASGCRTQLIGAGSGPGGVVRLTVASGATVLPPIEISPAGAVWVDE